MAQFAPLIAVNAHLLYKITHLTLLKQKIRNFFLADSEF